MARPRSGCWTITAILFVLIVSTAVFGIRILPFRLPDSFYDSSQPPEAADVIVILGGDLRSRVPRAVELHEEGFAEVVVITGAEAGQSHALLERLGESSVWIEPDATSTIENARFTMRMISSRIPRPETVLLVTNWWHSRRALACFRNISPETTFIAVAADTGRGAEIDEEPPLRREFSALIWYYLRHGIRPWRNE